MDEPIAVSLQRDVDRIDGEIGLRPGMEPEDVFDREIRWVLRDLVASVGCCPGCQARFDAVLA